MTGRTQGWRRYPARSGESTPSRRPPLVEARVQFMGTTALVEIINRQGSIVEVKVRGISPSSQIISISGNTRGSFPFEVIPGAEVTIHLGGAAGPILFRGTAPGGAVLNPPEDTDEQDERSPFPLPGGEPWGWGGQASVAPDSGPGADPGSDT